MGSIVKFDSMELGCGNMNLRALIKTAKELGVEAIILESHRNWFDNSPIMSFQRSMAYLNKHV